MREKYLDAKSEFIQMIQSIRALRDEVELRGTPVDPTELKEKLNLCLYRTYPPAPVAPHCEIVVVLDRSGSMATIQSDMIGGFNTFIEEQKKGKGTCNVTLVQFNDGPNSPETMYFAKPVGEVPKLHFHPSGSTALLDALGKTIGDTRERLKNAENTKVIFVVITDGQENASKFWHRGDIKNLVKDCTEKGWLFQFLGANIDSFAEGMSLGIRSISTMDYAPNSAGVSHLFVASARSAMSYRGSTGTMEEAIEAAAFTQEERAKATNQ